MASYLDFLIPKDRGCQGGKPNQSGEGKNGVKSMFERHRKKDVESKAGVPSSSNRRAAFPQSVKRRVSLSVEVSVTDDVIVAVGVEVRGRVRVRVGVQQLRESGKEGNVAP